MVRKKIDNRIRVLIENGVAEKHRSMFVVVGDRGKDQVVILHHILSKSLVKARPSVLWCYKKELGFSSHRKKRMKQLQKKIRSGKLNVHEDDPFELFIASTTIRYCYYAETHKILGNTYGMCVLQDFEALTPNLLARTVETVEGGGLVVVLLRSMDSLRQLYTLAMDVHARYRTESHQDVVGRFNERFLLSLASCKSCMVIDDQLNILPISSHMLNIAAVPPRASDDPLPPKLHELDALKESLQDTQPVGVLVKCCKTLDQAKALLKFVEAVSEKTLRSTVTLTAARGRGKSAALGLAMATAIAFGYSNVFVTSPSPENLKTLFDFIFKGFDAMDFQEHIDYDVVQSTNPEFNKAIVRVNIFREHRQTIQYIQPSDAHKLGQAELVVIDEAAAIPLPLVKALLGPYLVFMASTINGYEGTGRSLSLKLVQQLRQQSASSGSLPSAAGKKALGAAATGAATDAASATGRHLCELTLSESIRYADGDPVEAWLNGVLCLDATVGVPRILSGCPLPDACDLYYVSRDTLFSYHRASEQFLQRLMALYVASHYKNTPNDLQMLSDAPAHHIFCLLPPIDPTSSTLPEVLCVVQVCLEGDISRGTVVNSLARGKRASGDLIPWTVSQQFQDHDFPALSGARVVRIATHPDYQGMGYGSQALRLLQRYYEGKTPSLDEEAESHDTIEPVSAESLPLLEEHIEPRKNLPPLLLKLSERKAEPLDYLGVSFGLTAELLKFWKRAGFSPVYVRQTANDLTGEHSAILLKVLNEEESDSSWLEAFCRDFRKRFVSLLSYQFKAFSPALSLMLLLQSTKKKNSATTSATAPLTRTEQELYFTSYDLKRLELYSQNVVDYHLIMDLLPDLARLYFLGKAAGLSLSALQQALLVGMGLQRKSIDELEKELQLPGTQLLGLFSKVVRKFVNFLNDAQARDVEASMAERSDTAATALAAAAAASMEPTEQTLSAEMKSLEKQEKDRLKKVHLDLLNDEKLAQYKIKGSEDDWQEALKSGRGAGAGRGKASTSAAAGGSLVSVKGIEAKKRTVDIPSLPNQNGASKGHGKKHKKARHK